MRKIRGVLEGLREYIIPKDAEIQVAAFNILAVCGMAEMTGNDAVRAGTIAAAVGSLGAAVGSMAGVTLAENKKAGKPEEDQKSE